MNEKYIERLNRSISSDEVKPISSSKKKSGKTGRPKNYYAKRLIALGMSLGITLGAGANIAVNKIDNKMEELQASKTLTLNRSNAVVSNKNSSSYGSFWYDNRGTAKQIIEESLQTGRSIQLYIYDCLMSYDIDVYKQMEEMFSYLSKEMKNYITENNNFEYDYDFQIIANCSTFEEYCKAFDLIVYDKDNAVDKSKTLDNIKTRAEAIQMADFAREDARQKLLDTEKEYEKLICPVIEKIENVVQKFN